MSSVQKSYGAPAWTLGYVNVSTSGTPVNIMTNIDANNVNAPQTVTSANNSTEYTRSCRAIAFQGYKPGNNNVGMVPNSGYVYILVSPTGNNTGNLTDPGAMIKVLPPGGDVVIQAYPPGADLFSPYSYFLDSDANNEGALVTIYGATNP